MHLQEVSPQVGDRVVVRIPLSGGNGSKEEKDCIGEIIGFNEDRARIKLDEGDEIDIYLSDIIGIFQGVYEVEPGEYFSQEIFEIGLDIIFIVVRTIIWAVGFACWLLSLPLEGIQWIKMRRSAGRIG